MVLSGIMATNEIDCRNDRLFYRILRNGTKIENSEDGEEGVIQKKSLILR